LPLSERELPDVESKMASMSRPQLDSCAPIAAPQSSIQLFGLLFTLSSAL